MWKLCLRVLRNGLGGRRSIGHPGSRCENGRAAHNLLRRWLKVVQWPWPGLADFLVVHHLFYRVPLLLATTLFKALPRKSATTALPLFKHPYLDYIFESFNPSQNSFRPQFPWIMNALKLQRKFPQFRQEDILDLTNRFKYDLRLLCCGANLV